MHFRTRLSFKKTTSGAKFLHGEVDIFKDLTMALEGVI